MHNKVLLLDDDKLSLELMKLFLEEEGFQVYAATGCGEARSLFEKHQPEVVILDVELNDGSGIEFAKYVKNRGSIKVIIASGHSSEYLGNNGLNPLLMDGILTKPIELSELKAAVQSQ